MIVGDYVFFGDYVIEEGVLCCFCFGVVVVEVGELVGIGDEELVDVGDVVLDEELLVVGGY